MHIQRVIRNQHGRPNDQLKKGKNNAQNQLRKQLRKEHFNDRQNLYHQIMDKPGNIFFVHMDHSNLVHSDIYKQFPALYLLYFFLLIYRKDQWMVCP
jgi:hypothetical protein